MKIDSIVRIQIFVYVTTLGVDAVLRWMLSKVSADPLIYLRDLLLISAAGFSAWYAVRQRVDSRHIAALWWGLLLLMGIGLTAGLPIAQVLFGLKVWIPFAVGFMLVDSGAIAALNRPRMWAALWLLLCAGIVWNHYTRFPWSGLMIQLGDTAVQANREWTTYGVRRLSGFSRSSYDGAILVLLLHIYLSHYCESFSRKVALCAISAGTLYLTTSKGAIGAFLCTLPLAVVLPYVRSRVSLIRFPLIAIILVAALIGALAPIFSAQMAAPTFARGSVEAKLFESLVDRGWTTWPSAFALLNDWQWITGRGLGGIGSAQGQFEPLLASPADNFFVFLYVTGGIFGVAFYLFLAILVFRLSMANAAERMAFTYLVAIFTYGLTASLIDNAIFAMAVGGVFATLSCVSFGRRAQSEDAIDSPRTRPFSNDSGQTGGRPGYPAYTQA